jgi:UDP-N-acetylmuramoylalanine-D-glutamate ligase
MESRRRPRGSPRSSPGRPPAALAGNIGAPLSGFLSQPGPRDFVCELSSFQLEGVDRFRPHVAV